MAAVLAVLLPILAKAAADGTLIEIVEAAVTLIRLVLPLVESPAVQAELAAGLRQLQAAAPRPAQPEDPAMERVAPAHKTGGR